MSIFSWRNNDNHIEFQPVEAIIIDTFVHCDYISYDYHKKLEFVNFCFSQNSNMHSHMHDSWSVLKNSASLHIITLNNLAPLYAKKTLYNTVIPKERKLSLHWCKFGVRLHKITAKKKKPGWKILLDHNPIFAMIYELSDKIIHWFIIVAKKKV